MFQRLVLIGSFTVLLVPCGVLLAQGNYASVTGIVRDAQGASVPQAAVTIRNVDTGVDRTVHTSESGDFTITNLPPGPYEISAERGGFRKYQRVGIVLEIGQVLRSDIQLELGQVSESISVTAQAAALNTENGAIQGDVISRQEIMELPLDERDFTDLAFLVPGVLPAASGGEGSFAAINGARADSTNFYVDGISNRNARDASPQVRPNLGAMQEFKMETSGYSAEMGRMAGGVMNMVLRSGTNHYHGEVFEYIRNNIIDARGFFDPEKLGLHRNQYGATFEGPVRLPKLYDGRNRSFFMFSWESYKQNIGQTSITRVPSLLERNLDFSQSFSLTSGAAIILKDPLNNNTQFPGNRIPASRLSPVAAKLMAYYPQPNRGDPRNNFIAVANVPNTWDSFVVKADHRFNEKNTVTYRTQVRFNHTTSPFTGSAMGGFPNTSNDKRSLMGLDYIHLFTATLLVEVHSGFSRNNTYAQGPGSGKDMFAELGMPSVALDPNVMGWPRFTVTDYAPIGAAANQPNEHHVTDIQNSAKLTWARSRHVMKWGFEYARVRINQPYYNNNRGTYAFSGAWTSSALADLELGYLNRTTRLVGVPLNYLRAANTGAFFNDDFKVKPNLTLNLGLRYEFLPIPYDKYDHIMNFVPQVGKVVIPFDDPSVKSVISGAGLQSYVTYAAAAGLPRRMVYPDYNNMAPRFGFAWRPKNTTRTVLRGGYGIFYSGHVLNSFRTNLQDQFPYALTATFNRVSNQPTQLTLSNPFPSSRQTIGGMSTSAGYQIDARTSYVQSYNLTVERELRGMVLEIGYTGSKGTHLGRLRDINLPRVSEAAYLAGIATKDLRPFPFLDGAISVFGFHYNSIYSAGRLSLRKRGGGRTFYRLNYTYSKSIDDVSQLTATPDGGLDANSYDPNSRRLDHGRSDFDRGHVVTASFSWQLPFGHGNRWLTSAGGLKQAVIGGWQLSGTTFLATGRPMTIIAAGASTDLGESLKPNRIGKGIPADVPGQRRGVDYPWFVPTDFVKVPQCVSPTVGCPRDAYGFKPFVYGNSGRNILDGPGTANLNLAMMKNFRVGEQKNVQFRLESFNALNHPNFGVPNNQFNSSTAGLITEMAQGPRIFQAGLKFQF
jgi:hypothetical protein